MEFTQFLSIFKIFSGKDGGSFLGIVQSIIVIFVFFIVNYFFKKIPDIIKKTQKEKLPTSDLDKVLNGKAPWEISVSCNFDDICLCQDTEELTKHMLDIIDKQRKSENPRITFNFMRIKNVNTYFCVAVKNIVLKVLAENNIFMHLVFPKDGPEKLIDLYTEITVLVKAADKDDNILVRHGERFTDDHQ